MTILWFGIAKFVVSLIALTLAIIPLHRYVKQHRRFPNKVRHYLPLFVVLTLIVVTPFKLAPGIQTKQTILSFDTEIQRVEQVEAVPRTEYGAPDNRESIDSIMKEGK